MLDIVQYADDLLNFGLNSNVLHGFFKTNINMFLLCCLNSSFVGEKNNFQSCI